MHADILQAHFQKKFAVPGTKISYRPLPDHPNRIFQLDEYQQDVGKAYNRITLFLLKRSDLESYNELRHNTSDSDDEAEESTVRQMTVIESFARVTDSTTRNTTKQTTAGPSTSENIFSNNNENLPGTSCSLYESARGTVSGMKTMREMFPNRGDSELKQALELNETLEEAINMVVEDDDRSVNNRYGSLITEECDTDVNILHDDDENLESFFETSSSHYTVNATLTEKLEHCKEQFMDSSSTKASCMGRYNDKTSKG